MSEAASIPRVVVRGAPPTSRPGAEGTVEQKQNSTAQIDIVEEWGLQSFPASDPPANW